MKLVAVDDECETELTLDVLRGDNYRFYSQYFGLKCLEDLTQEKRFKGTLSFPEEN